jgi:hypothetical protein
MAVTCVVCASRLNDGPFPPGDHGRELIYYPCPRCGDFRISWEANDDIGDALRSHPERRAILSHGIRRMRRATGNKPPVILNEVARRILERGLPTATEQVDNLLLWLGEQEGGRTGAAIDVPYPFGAGIVGCLDRDGVNFAVQALAEKGLIRHRDVQRTRQVFTAMGADPEPEQYDAASTMLTLEGWRRHQELTRAVTDSRLAFMAMPFGDEQLDQVFMSCFKRAVGQTGFDLRRLTDEQSAGLIDDRLRVEIRRSRFLVCELTQDNRGAYWEAGFAEGLGRPVIYTCHKDHHPLVHFDTNHYLTVLWDPERLEQAATELKAVIRATLPTEAKLSDD